MKSTVLPPHATCSCNHARAVHFGLGSHSRQWCTGLDSYDVPCSCPSFELSQECREAIERGERL